MHTSPVEQRRDNAMKQRREDVQEDAVEERRDRMRRGRRRKQEDKGEIGREGEGGEGGGETGGWFLSALSDEPALFSAYFDFLNVGTYRVRNTIGTF